MDEAFGRIFRNTKDLADLHVAQLILEPEAYRFLAARGEFAHGHVESGPVEDGSLRARSAGRGGVGLHGGERRRLVTGPDGVVFPDVHDLVADGGIEVLLDGAGGGEGFGVFPDAGEEVLDNVFRRVAGAQQVEGVADEPFEVPREQDFKGAGILSLQSNDEVGVGETGLGLGGTLASVDVPVADDGQRFVTNGVVEVFDRRERCRVGILAGCVTIVQRGEDRAYHVFCVCGGAEELLRVGAQRIIVVAEQPREGTGRRFASIH